MGGGEAALDSYLLEVPGTNSLVDAFAVEILQQSHETRLRDLLPHRSTLDRLDLCEGLRFFVRR